MVRWLGGTVPDSSGATPRTSIPHNRPSLQHFFGREEELRKIADALDPESRTWGALIDGPGGMGKTSLAVRAAYACTQEQFDKIAEDFSRAETHALCALTYFTLPAKVEHVATVADRDEAETETALKSLINRSLVVPSDELKTFALVPLVADNLRVKKPEVLRETRFPPSRE